MALRNRLDNARRHGTSNTPVDFIIEANAQHIRFTVCNGGEPVAEEMLEQLTQRFWRSSYATGSGLGLAIVAAIAQRFHGELQFFARPEGGLKAMLSWPRYYP